ncbi:hypothetical protein ILUMI_06939 [Ignelater luminosus]|uniref:Uncharacterized protein n=1 Tax=Ignelater luminosus TaxID=2038154 RepID=A0A8K0GHA5_IGNLU|nr:hypothetical protein ILUMI_06939 [Ignelater luminosus]
MDQDFDFKMVVIRNDIDVVVLPPAPEQLTDEEDVDNDNLYSTEVPTDILDTLEVFLRFLGVETQFGSDSEYDSSDNKTLSSKRIRLMSTTKRMRKQLNRKNSNFLQPDWKKCNSKYSSWKTPSDDAANRVENVTQELKNPKDSKKL